MKKAIFLVGMPASGKSTWCENQPGFFVDQSTFGGGSGYRYIDRTFIASSDDIIESIAREHGLSYDEIFQDAIGLSDKIFWNLIKSHARQDYDLIIDRTNLNAKSRKKTMERLRTIGYQKFDAVVFPLPDKETWDNRLNSRPGKTIPQNILDSMLKSFEFPTVQEGFDNVTIFSMETV